MSIRDLAQEPSGSLEPLKVMTAEYTVEETGHVRDEPIVHLICRRPNGERRQIEVEGVHPHFYISIEEFVEKKKELLNEGRIRQIELGSELVETPTDYVDEETAEALADKEIQFSEAVKEVDTLVTTLHDEPLVRIVCGIPDHVSNNKNGGLKDYFNTTWEADVFFTQRFLITEGVKTGIRAPDNKDRIHVSDFETMEPEDTPNVTPRTIYLDIEVYNEGDFPEPEDADQPVTSISAYDNYDDEYKVWVLQNENWDYDSLLGDNAEKFKKHNEHNQRKLLERFFEEQYNERWPGVRVRVFTDEATMLDNFHDYITERRPDILTGWNAASNDRSNGFDFPYLVNRSMNINAWNIKDWSPIKNGDVYCNRAAKATVAGVELFDMMQAYEKTQIHELRSYSLEYVATKELGYGKEEIGDLSDAWRDDPEQFLRYNIRDTEAMVEIEESQSVLDMYNHLREVTGALYAECHHNISMIDMLFLRDALKKDTALPTSRKPDVKHYHGAKVFNPSPGLHTNVFYPDLASLYPNLFWATNMSPETVIGTKDDLEESDYTVDQCFTVYYDPRDEQVKKDAEASDVVEDALYVLKPDVKEGFVRDSIGDLIDMKYEYKGTDKYEAVKRVTNSVYGVMGDSDTYGIGFRLFDNRIAEAITLAGRKVLEFTANTIQQYLQDNGYADADIVGGDTDSAMCSVPSMNINEYILEAAHRGYDEHIIFEAAEYTDAQYDGLMADEFGIDVSEGYEHKMAVEIESYAKTCFFLRDFKSDDPNDGLKKKYGQLITWDEDDGVIKSPKPKFKGFKLVRSDSSTITAWTQTEVLRIILTSDNPKDDVYDFLEDVITNMKNGDLPALSEMYGSELTMADVGIPSGIGADLDQYGREKHDDGTYGKHVRTPSPHIRGAKWVNDHIQGEDISSGSKPLLFYIEEGRIGGDLPNTYSTEESLEDGNLVDALAVESADSFPDEAQPDWPLMNEKTVKNANEDIAHTMGWTWDDITGAGRQSGLGAFA